jgi:hypothetical protein
VGKIDSSHLRFFLTGIYGYLASEKSSRSEPFFSSITVKVSPVRPLKREGCEEWHCLSIITLFKFYAKVITNLLIFWKGEGNGCSDELFCSQSKSRGII